MNLKKIKGINYKTGSQKAINFISKIWSLIFVIVLIAFFSSRGVNFFSIKGLQNVLIAATLISLVAIGETFVVISGGIDISVSYVLGLIATCGGIIMREFYSAGLNQSFVLVIGIISILILSLIPGFINGIIITKLKVPPFIATLGVMGIAQGGAYLLNNGMPVIGLPPLAGQIGNSYILYYVSGKGIKFFNQHASFETKSAIGIFPVTVLIVLIVILISGYILSKTKFGQHTYAIGGNINASRFLGVPVDNHLIKIYMISSFMCGIAAISYIIRFSMASPNAGEPLLINSIGAIFIGGASMSGGYGSISGTIIGAIIIALLQTGLVSMAVSPFWQYLTVGCIIIIAVFFDQLKYKLFNN